MNHPSCDPFLDDLPLYLTGDLDAIETQRLEAHLQDCDRCRATLAEQRRVVGLLGQLTPEQVPLDVPSDFFDSRIAPRLQASRRPWRTLAKAAALILMFLSGMFLQRGLFGQDSRGPASSGTFLKAWAAEAGQGNDLSRSLIALGRLKEGKRRSSD